MTLTRDGRRLRTVKKEQGVVVRMGDSIVVLFELHKYVLVFFESKELDNLLYFIFYRQIAPRYTGSDP